MKDKPKANRGLSNQRAQAAVLKKKSKRSFGSVGLSAVMLEPIGDNDNGGGGFGENGGGNTHNNRTGKNHFMTAHVKGIPRSGGMGVSGFFNVFQTATPYDANHGTDGNVSPLNADQMGMDR